jgi:hypothetical protein
MPEIKRRVKTVEINYACDECSVKPNPGCVLKKTGQVFMTHPEKYQHECPNCKKKFSLPIPYPYIDYILDPDYFI